MTKDEALRLALEALETSMYPQQKQLQAITAIKAALEAKDEPIQEPAAWISKHNVVYPLDAWHEVHPINELKPLYTTPPQRTWVGLTDDDKVLIKHDANYNQFMTAGEYADRVQQLTEARLKDKNT